MRSSMLVVVLLLSAHAVARTAQELRLENNPSSIPSVDPKLFNKRRHLSPRVLFSADPQTLSQRTAYMAPERGLEGEPSCLSTVEFTLCESVSVWVGNKTKAMDISGNEVTVLPNVNINNVNKKQYFFETTCHSAHSGSSSCLGIDARHWNSNCTNSHTFVRALTSFKNLVAWRLIRINVACVCVLSRKSWRQ